MKQKKRGRLPDRRKQYTYIEPNRRNAAIPNKGIAAFFRSTEIINDAYCRDISVKTRSVLNVKRENGDFIGACPVYGYRKSDEDKNQLVIDEYASHIVKDIFTMKLGGYSAVRIADSLNALGILSPYMYKKENVLPHEKRLRRQV